MESDAGQFEGFLAALSPGQLAELGKRIEEATAAQAPAKAPPLKLNLAVTVRDSDSVDPEGLHKELSRATAGEPLLSPEELDSLRSAQSALVKWIAASKENAARFAVSPLDALREAELAVSPKLVDRLKAMGQEVTKMGMPPGLPLDGLALQAERTGP